MTAAIIDGKSFAESLRGRVGELAASFEAAAGRPLKSLERRRIRVRGWIEQRGGPRIHAERPGQIELLED